MSSTRFLCNPADITSLDLSGCQFHTSGCLEKVTYRGFVLCIIPRANLALRNAVLAGPIIIVMLGLSN
jgi:hypothetical protein